MQLKEEEERIEEGEADTRKKLKAMRDHNKEWDGTRETRVSRLYSFLAPVHNLYLCPSFQTVLVNLNHCPLFPAGWHMARICE